MRHLAFSTKIILGLAVITLTVTYFSLPWGELFQSSKQLQPSQVACTKEAKTCPDGSSVGRTGPRCEFTPCPMRATPEAEPMPTAWKTARIDDLDTTFEYPASWGSYAVTTKPGVERGSSKIIEFASSSMSDYDLPIWISFASAGLISAGGEGSPAEHRTDLGLVTSCATYVTEAETALPASLGRCKFTQKSFGNTLTTVANYMAIDSVAVGFVSFTSGSYPFLSFEREYRSDVDLQLIQRMVDSVRKI